MKKQYACLECGFVHEGKVAVRERVDEEGGSHNMCTIISFHGYITNRICPECGAEKQIKVEEDK